MRKILLLVLILAPCLHGFSQGKKDKPDTTGSSSQRSTPPKGSKKNQHLFSNSNQSKTTQAGKFRTLNNRTNISEKELRNTLKLPQEVTLKSVNTTTDKQGFRHETLQQYYKNLPIIGYQIFKHSKKNLILQGETPKIKELEVKPAFSAEDAIAKAKTHLKVTETLNDYPAELKILRNSDKEFVLVYEVRIDAAKPLTMKKVFIDAKSGKPIKTLNLIAHADTPATAHTLYSGIKNITTDSYQGGYRLRESTRNIETYNAKNGTLGSNGFTGVTDYTNSSTTWRAVPHLTSFTITDISDWATSDLDYYYLVIYDKDEHIMAISNYTEYYGSPLVFDFNIMLDNGPYEAAFYNYNNDGADQLGGTYTLIANEGTHEFSDDNNTIRYTVEARNSYAMDVHWGMEKTYDFYLNVLGRDSYDNNGSVIKQYINPLELQTAYGAETANNAFAYPAPYNVMCYGLGNNVDMGPVVGLDVEGHEFSHMVIDNNGNGGLYYQGESGALNESFADIFGTCVEFYASNNPNWNIGEDVTIADPFLRSMSAPKTANQPDTYAGDNWANTNSSWDNGGVHINSGVQNKWFYLLSEGGSGTNDNGYAYEVSGIGIEKARDIAYRNLMYYLEADASYIDAYYGSLQAAEDLYGTNSAEYNTVSEAWMAVGVSNFTCIGSTILTDAEGAFSDGSGYDNYSHYLNCQWTILPPGAESITITFTEFDIEKDHDYVYIYGSNSVDPLFSFTGDDIPQVVTIPGSAAYILFSTDGETAGQGWSATYSSTGTSTCSGRTDFSEPEGTITDGSGDENYGNNSNCTFYITPPCANTVTLSFSEFNLEDSYDFLVISDGMNILSELTGDDIPEDITSSTGVMILEFTSDFSVTRSGFTASYTSDGKLLCSRNTEITDSEGTITDGSGDDNYCNNQNCSWLIAPTDAETVTISFTEFALEDIGPDGTIYDAVEIYDGDSEDSELIGIYSGSTIPEPITSTGNSIFIKFHSDLYENAAGWSLNYTANNSDPVLGLDNEFFNDIKIYPNPAKDQLIIENWKQENVKMTITDLIGHQYLQPYQMNSGEHQIDISSLATGLYLLNFQTAKEVVSYKIAVE